MSTTKKIILSALILGIFAISCSKSTTTTPTTTAAATNLDVNFNGLEDLGSNFAYEGWIMVDGSPVSTGLLTGVKPTNFTQAFTVDATKLAKATQFILTIEPKPDTDPKPSTTKILSGSFPTTGALVNIATVNSKTQVADFSNVAGKYILATPTSTATTDEESGVWFLENNSGTMTVGLTLPTLAAGWKYEGWAVLPGKAPLSTGTFTMPAGADANATTSTYKGANGNGPAFPGEDFLMNAPTGHTFPLSLKGATVVISVEPSPDNSSAPFSLKPLKHVVPTGAMTHTTINMEKNTGAALELVGTVTRK